MGRSDMAKSAFMVAMIAVGALVAVLSLSTSSYYDQSTMSPTFSGWGFTILSADAVTTTPDSSVVSADGDDDVDEVADSSVQESAAAGSISLDGSARSGGGGGATDAPFEGVQDLTRLLGDDWENPAAEEDVAEAPESVGKAIASLKGSNVPRDQYKGPDRRGRGTAVLELFRTGSSEKDYKYDLKYTIVVKNVLSNPTEVVVGTGLPFRMGDLTGLAFPGQWKKPNPTTWVLRGYLKDVGKNIPKYGDYSYLDDLWTLIFDDPGYYYLNVRTKKNPSAALRGHFKKYSTVSS